MGTTEELIAREAEALVREAAAAGLTCAAAESCTGGLVCGAITDVAGSSAVLRGGVVSYDPQVKHDVLGVAQHIIDDPSIGVVSRECAQQMAEGARALLKADLAVSVTGIAGPGGAEPQKPVGTVWFGLASASGVSSQLHHFEGNRCEVRARAVLCALGLLRGAIVERRSDLGRHG